MNSNVWSLKKLLKWNTKIHFTLDIPLYEVLSSHLIVMSAEKWEGEKRTEASFLQLWEKKQSSNWDRWVNTHEINLFSQDYPNRDFWWTAIFLDTSRF